MSSMGALEKFLRFQDRDEHNASYMLEKFAFRMQIYRILMIWIFNSGTIILIQENKLLGLW